MGLRERKKLELEEKIRSASRDVFLQQGYTQATVEQIAEKAGIGVGSIYNYFPSKADIFLAIMARELKLGDDDEQQLESDLERDVTESILELLGPLFRTTKLLGRRVWRELMAAAFSTAKASSFLAKGMMKLDYRLIGRIEAYLAQRKERGAFAEGFDAHQAAMAVYSCAMAQFMIYVYQEEVDFEAFTAGVRAQIRFLFEGKALPATSQEIP